MFFFTISHEKIVHVFIIANEVKKLFKKFALKIANHCWTKTKKNIKSFRSSSKSRLLHIFRI